MCIKVSIRVCFSVNRKQSASPRVQYKVSTEGRMQRACSHVTAQVSCVYLNLANNTECQTEFKSATFAINVGRRQSDVASETCFTAWY